MPGLPEAKGVKILWEHDYWDGPLDGVCEWDGEKYYFQLIEDAIIRPYWLKRLSENEWVQLQTNHLLYQEHVGFHTDYINGKHSGATRKPEAEWKKYHDNKQPLGPFCGPIVAWFQR